MTAKPKRFTPADLFLAPEVANSEVQQYLGSLGFRDPDGADRNLQLMAEDYAVRQALGALAEPLLEAFSRAPDPDAALISFERYLAAVAAKVNFLDYLREDLAALELLVQVVGTSPFLAEILIRNTEYFHSLRHDFDRSVYDGSHCGDEIDSVLRNLDNSGAKLDALKRFKRREILRIAARDILNKDSLQSSTAQLSRLADILVQRTLQVVMEPPPQGHDRTPGDFCVMGMGKLGGWELNYSSDIDLIYLYDSVNPTAGAERSFQKLARELTRALTEHSGESYLFRVDLRLRPMGKTGAITYSIQQYRHYYESWGETFERFALIKARPVAGNLGLGIRFLEMTGPFVYRKYLDHAAVEEIARIKARLDAEHKGETERNVKTGRGGIREIELFTQILQLLYGGQMPELRQSNTLESLQTLLRAGLITDSVCSDLTEAYIFLRMVEHRLQIVQERQLHLLPSDKIEKEICARRLGFQSTAQLETALSAHRNRVHEIYRSLLAEKDMDEASPAREFFRALSGEVPEQQTLQKLQQYGFKDPAAVFAAIQALDQGTSLAHSRSSTRNLLANLLPMLLEEVAACAEPQRVLIRIEQTASATGTTAALLRTLLEDPALRHNLLGVLDAGELLAQRLIRHPELLDWLATPVDIAPPHRKCVHRGGKPAVAAKARPRIRHPGGDNLEPFFHSALDAMETTELLQRMNELRRFKRAEEFKILAGWLFGNPLEQMQQKLSLLAECCVRRVALWHDPLAVEEMVTRRGGEGARGRGDTGSGRHGDTGTQRGGDAARGRGDRPTGRRGDTATGQGRDTVTRRIHRSNVAPSPRRPLAASPFSSGHQRLDSSDWVIFALGKLGGSELTVHSDLDLVFIYGGDPADSEMFTHYQSFVQSFQNFLEQPTSEGVAYRIDTRLRPEGNKGALAIPLLTFQHYLPARADKWERLAWTRSRFIAGSASLAAKVSRAVESFVYGPWDGALVDFMDKVRGRMEAELSRESEAGRLDLKVGRGGLADIDFLLQLIQIRVGNKHTRFRIGGTRRLLAALAESESAALTRLLSKKELNSLRSCYLFLCRLEIFARMHSDSNISWIATDMEALRPLANRMGMVPPQGEKLLDAYRQTTDQVRQTYRKVLERLQ